MKRMTGIKIMTAAFSAALGVFLFVGAAFGFDADEKLVDKTLVVWAAVDDADARSGAALAIADVTAGKFDAVVFGEITPKVWMPGSDYFKRTNRAQDTWPKNDAPSGDAFDLLAVSYRGRQVDFYRNGEKIDSFTSESDPQPFGDTARVLFGRRFPHAETFVGRVKEARIYREALSAEEIAALTPGQAEREKLWAWWNFSESTDDLTGRYASSSFSGKARIENGVLTLGLGGTFTAVWNGVTDADCAAVRRVRRAELNDPWRPVWHLTVAEGNASPFDPNGAIFKDGVYHLWYLYQAEAGQQWQHLTSLDLFHWRWHSFDLQHRDGDPDEGIFSGNAFLAPDGKTVIAYHGLGTGGNCVAVSGDEDLETWTKPAANPIAHPGWDPSMWYEDGKYYQISGGNPLEEENPALLYVGDAYDRPMEKVGHFMTRDMPDVEEFEDISCPDFFPMGDKRVLVCISHTKGARYYIGTWDGKQFTPESHHRMNWPGGTCFAPETLLDDAGRRIFWAWTLDNKTGVSSGTMTMPRVLTMADDKKSLLINPPKEIERLRYQPTEIDALDVEAGESLRLHNVAGKVMELEIVIDSGLAKRFGVKVLASADGREATPIVVDREKNLLSVDLTKTSLAAPEYRTYTMLRDPNPVVTSQDAPFELADGEKTTLRIFLDRSMLEVFANGRQCVTQRVYPTLDDAAGIVLFTEDAPIRVESIRAWRLFPAMQW